MNKHVKSVKSLPFSCKAAEFPTCKLKFSAMRTNQGCEDILTDDTCKVEKEDPRVTLSSTEQDKQDEAKKQNKTGFMFLILSISPSDTTPFGAIQNAKTDDLPKGDTKTEWKKILGNYSAYFKDLIAYFGTTF
jgi:hypothetical protein